MGLSHDTGACENCGTSVHRTGQNWQHIGGHYRCPGSHWDGDGFAVRGELVRAASEGLYEAVHEEVADDVREDVLGEATAVLRMRGYVDAANIVSGL